VSPEHKSERLSTPPDAATAADVAVTLALDDLCARAVTALAGRGVDAVVLKGPTLAGWLYPGEHRHYDDCDLLVAPDALETARGWLRESGFVRFEPPTVRPGLELAAAELWSHGWEQIDLHQSFWGLAGARGEVWTALSAHIEPGTVAGRPVQVLDVPARLLLIVLHALHHGPSRPKPMEDLRRAVAQVGDDDWRAALGLGTALGAVPAFAAVLPAVAGGAGLSARLGLGPAAGVRAAATRSGLGVSDGIERFTQAPGAPAKARIIAAEMAPSAAFMRWKYPFARRGRRALGAAYVLRAGELTVTAARLAAAWARGRR
jgi:hypothetical protein